MLFILACILEATIFQIDCSYFIGRCISELTKPYQHLVMFSQKLWILWQKTVIFSFFTHKRLIFQDEVTIFGRNLLLGCIGMASQLYEILGKFHQILLNFWSKNLSFSVPFQIDYTRKLIFCTKFLIFGTMMDITNSLYKATCWMISRYFKVSGGTLK